MDSLYSPTILEHFRRPRNYGDLEAPDLAREVYNPVCGDRIRLMLRVDDGRVAAARFKGDACAIAKAAASLLTEMLDGRSLDDAANVQDDELLAALDAEIAPSRRVCALLPLKALREAVADDRADAARIACIVLAAGAARRFGDANKLLAPLGGAPVVRRTVENVLAAPFDDVVVVLGRDADDVRGALDDLPVRFVVNPRWAEGMSTSLRAGVDALPARVDAALIALGDQPSVTPAILGRVAAAYRDSRKPIVAPFYRGVRANPVLFDAAVFPELLRVRGDRGARDVVARDDGRVEAVAFDSPPPPDIDTREDYEALLARWRA